MDADDARMRLHMLQARLREIVKQDPDQAVQGVAIGVLEHDRVNLPTGTTMTGARSAERTRNATTVQRWAGPEPAFSLRRVARRSVGEAPPCARPVQRDNHATGEPHRGELSSRHARMVRRDVGDELGGYLHAVQRDADDTTGALTPGRRCDTADL
jgi:hypothetical protein